MYVQARLSLPGRIILSMAVGSGDPDRGNVRPGPTRFAGRSGSAVAVWRGGNCSGLGWPPQKCAGRAYSNSRFCGSPSMSPYDAPYWSAATDRGPEDHSPLADSSSYSNPPIVSNKDRTRICDPPAHRTGNTVGKTSPPAQSSRHSQPVHGHGQHRGDGRQERQVEFAAGRRAGRGWCTDQGGHRARVGRGGRGGAARW